MPDRSLGEKERKKERKIRFRAFPERFCPRILSLESVDYFGTSEHFGGRKKKKTRILIRKIKD